MNIAYGFVRWYIGTNVSILLCLCMFSSSSRVSLLFYLLLFLEVDTKKCGDIFHAGIELGYESRDQMGVFFIKERGTALYRQETGILCGLHVRIAYSRGGHVAIPSCLFMI